MKKTRGIPIAVAVLFACNLPIPFSAIAQTSTGDQVRQGMQAFYEAEFEQALVYLQQALRDTTLTPSQRFDAHLYSAFSLIRQSGQQDSIRSQLVSAVTTDPSRELDANLMPPDLYEQYAFVRQSMMGGVRIITEPESAVAIFYDRRIGKSVSLNTPASFYNMISGDYELLIHLEGYRDYRQSVQVRPGKTDSLHVSLNHLSRPWYKTWWAMGGAGVCAALVWLVFQDDGSEATTKEGDLPLPPSRP